MGCDIHLFAEKRAEDGWALLAAPPDGDNWDFDSQSPHSYRMELRTGHSVVDGYDVSPSGERTLRAWFEDRNTYLFGLLAGVRGGEALIDDPRGVPADASTEYKDASMDYDANHGRGYSHSYFTVAELRKSFKSGTDPYMQNFILLMGELETYGAPDDIRIVFFFDN